LLLTVSHAQADLVPFSGNQTHADPFLSPTNIYSTVLGPGAQRFERVNDMLPSANPWLDEVEWVVIGAAGVRNVQFFFFDGAMNVFSTAFPVGADLYIYTAYTQPDDLGQETGVSNFVLTNLTSFNARYGLGVTEGPPALLPPPNPMLPAVDGGGGGGGGFGQRNMLLDDGTTISVIAGISIPEPSAFVLMVMGLGALLGRRLITHGRKRA
jgi:hypothetical protein